VAFMPRCYTRQPIKVTVAGAGARPTHAVIVAVEYPSAFNCRLIASMVSTLPELASWNARSSAVSLRSTTLTRTTGKARRPVPRSTVCRCGRRGRSAPADDGNAYILKCRWASSSVENAHQRFERYRCHAESR
jgi:hypothetical protein